ncbi:MAG: radical SAM protein [Elusimicrobia bacterium]|nr:radical SAM protein [Elusimicrobiota bacterium]
MIKKFSGGNDRSGSRGSVFLEKGKQYMGSGKFDKAEKMLKKALKTAPNIHDVYFELGKMYLMQGKTEESLRELCTAKSLHGGHEHVSLLLAQVYRKLGETDLALKELGERIDEGSRDPRLYKEAGCVHMDRGEEGSAMENFRMALEYGLADREIYLAMYRVLKGKHKFGEALEILEMAAEHDRDGADIHMEIGRVNNKSGDYGSAVKRFLKAYNMGYRKADIYDDLMYSCYRLGDSGPLRRIGTTAEREAADLPFIGNKLLNMTEIIEGKEELRSFPRRLIVTVTSKCPLKCRMCEITDKSWELPGRTVDEICRLFPYLEFVQWLGGEVFMSDSFEYLFDKASGFPGLKQTMSTNGLLLDKRWAEKLAINGVGVTYSIDGITGDTYEAIRTGASFDRLIKSLGLLNDAALAKGSKSGISMNFVVMEKNVGEISGIVDFMKRNGISEVNISPLRYSDRQYEQRYNMILDRARESVADLMFQAGSSGVVVNNCLPSAGGRNGYGPEINTDPLRNDAGKTGCTLPWKQLYIAVYGGVAVGGKAECLGGNSILGSISEQSLMEIWNSERLRCLRREIKSSRLPDSCDPRCLSGIFIDNDIDRYCSAGRDTLPGRIMRT